MNMFRLLGVCSLIILGINAHAVAQDADRAERIAALKARFDVDGNGKLDADERQALRQFLKDNFGGNREKAALPQKLWPGEAPLYKFEQGPHELGEIKTVNLEDPDRKKIIPLRITYPKADGPFPVIVFCHGALGSNEVGDPLVAYWGSHGYIVIRPTFGDSAKYLSAEQIAKARSASDLVNSKHVFKQWDQRPQDVSHIIDALPDLAEQLKPLAGKIDMKRIAVAGHSYGALTTMQIAGLAQVNPQTREITDFRDKRVSATVMISPQGPTEMITVDSFKAMAGPLLMITGDNDGTPIRGREHQSGKWRAEAFEHTAPGDKYLLWIDGAYHGFGGINGRGRYSGAGPAAPDHVNLVKTTALAMFDAYVKQDEAAKAYLTTQRVAAASAGLAQLKAK